MLNFVVSLTTNDNDYQQEQASAAEATGKRLGVGIQVIHADNDAFKQSDQLLKIVQAPGFRPDGIIFEPVGTALPQVAKAAAAAGIGWVILNREAEYIPDLRRAARAPVFALSPDQEEVGRIQGKQLAVFATEGNILYIEGPSGSSAAESRTKGMLSTKPGKVEVKVLKGDWSERSAQQAVRSWLSLSTSRQMHVKAVICQNA